MDKWAELRTAYWVARLGTVSAAADKLNIHRATVVRHVDMLERELGGKLFQRHGRGYVPTEAGRDLLRVAGAAEEQFQHLAGRTRGRTSDVSGELVLTSIEPVGPLLLPAVRRFREAYPETTVHFQLSERLYQLEYGEAHVAVRSGARPTHPDNVVKPFFRLRSGIYAHRSYIERHGKPASVAELGQHVFVGDPPGVNTAPGHWLKELVPHPNIGFSSRSARANWDGIAAGIGLGFMLQRVAQQYPDLVEVHPPIDAWDVPFWLVTHIDLHWTAKVQAILTHLQTVSD